MVWNEGTAAVPAVRGTHTAAEINSFIAANARAIGLIDGDTTAAETAARIEAVQTAVTTAFGAAAAVDGETAAERGERIADAINGFAQTVDSDRYAISSYLQKLIDNKQKFYEES